MRGGLTTEVNPAMCRLLGRTREEILGRHPLELFSGEARCELERQLARRKSGTSGAYEVEIVRPDGTRLHCRNNASPLADAQGCFAGSVGLWTDVTALRRSWPPA